MKAPQTGGFGTNDTPGAVVGTTWNGPDIGMRREIRVPEGVEPSRIQHLVYRDDDAEIYLDGELAATETGYVTAYQPVEISAAAQALGRSFPHVRAFNSIEGWGLHFLASADPIVRRTARDLAARVPLRAAGDLLEWGPALTVEAQFQPVVLGEVPLRALPAETGPLR